VHQVNRIDVERRLTRPIRSPRAQSAGKAEIRGRWAAGIKLPGMGSKERAVDRGDRQGRRLIATTGNDLRLARMSAGLSLEDVGRAVGMSHSQLGRIERALHPSVAVIQLARIASVVGLNVSVRTYPSGSPLRDKAHLALIQRFRDRLSANLRRNRGSASDCR
jgi:transcriptional regulator with XRE-family HTH domain